MGSRGNSGAEELVRWAGIAIEDEDAFVIERKLRGLPGDMGGIEGLGFLLLGPAEEGGHPDRLHRFDVVGRLRGWGNVDDAFPHSVEAQEELDLFGAGEGSVHFHEALAAGTEERVLAPDAQDEISPEGAEVAGALGGRCGNGVRPIPIDVALPGLEFHAAALVGVAPVVTDGVLVLGRDVLDGGGEELRGGEDLKVALGAPASAGTVNDAPRFFVPSDLLKGKRSTKEILGELLATCRAVDGFVSGIEAEATVFPVQELAGLSFADDLLVEQGRDEAVAEEFGERFEALHGELMKSTLAVVETGGGEDVEVRMKDEVVAESLHCGDGCELAVREVETGPEPVAQALDGSAEEEVEEVASLAKDAAQGTRHGEDELPVRHLVTESVGDPMPGLADPALMARRTEVPPFAGEGQQLLMAAVGTLKAGEAGREVAAAVELLDHRERVGPKRSVGLTVRSFVVSEELVPAVVDDLPERRGAGASRAIDRWHKKCS